MIKKKKLRILDIRQAILTDSRFRDLFPELSQEIKKILKNPNCGCNSDEYSKFLGFKDRLEKYFSDYKIEDVIEDHQNHWKIINCKIGELEGILNKLHKLGQKQIAIARYQEELTVIINDVGLVV